VKASLLALTNLRKGFIEQAKEEVLQAADLLINHPLATYTLLIGLTATLETLLNLPEQDRVPSHDLLVAKLLKALRKYAKSNPVGIPALEHWQGLADWQAGRRQLAFKHWSRSSETAQRLAMPYELGMIHLEIAQHLLHSDPARLTHLKQAQQALSKINAQFYVGLVAKEMDASPQQPPELVITKQA